MKRYFTIKALLEHIRQNGLQQTTGQLINYTGTKPAAACAIGMAALNLGLNEHDLDSVLCRIKLPDGGNLRNVIVAMNDHGKKSFAQIADAIEEKYPDILYHRIAVDVKPNPHWKVQDFIAR